MEDADKSCEGYRLVMWGMQTSHMRVKSKSCGGCGDAGRECLVLACRGGFNQDMEDASKSYGG